MKKLGARIKGALSKEQRIARMREGRLAVARAEAGAEDHFAPVHFAARCVDGAGYKRMKHAFVVEARDGLRCAFCGVLQRMEAW